METENKFMEIRAKASERLPSSELVPNSDAQLIASLRQLCKEVLHEHLRMNSSSFFEPSKKETKL